MFLNRFDVLLLKINFKKNKKNYFDAFPNKKTSTAVPNTRNGRDHTMSTNIIKHV